jgi:replicative DNA helicase
MTTSPKIPPHSDEAEKSVLGSILIEKDAIIKVGDLLHPDDFYSDIHKLIFESMLELYEKRSPIDLLTLTEHLKDKKQLNLIGEGTYLAELTTYIATTSHIVEYALIIKNKATLRKLISSGSLITSLGYEEDKDIDQLLESAEKTLFDITQTFIKNKFIHIKEILHQRYEEFAELHDAEDKTLVRGTATGFKSMDLRLGGLKNGDLIIIAARPSMGKTSLALNIAQNIALQGKKTVGIFSLEMSKEQLVDRMFASLLGVDSWKLHRGELEDKDFSRLGEVMDELTNAKLFIDDSAASSVMELKSKARRLQIEHGLDLIIIDYLQLMSGNNPNNRVQEISEISRALKALARELHVPVMALSQLSRAVENRPGKIPQLSDLRESGAIEQDADVVMMMYREDYYEEDSDRPGITDIYIRKHRNGPTGRMELRFAKEQMRFYDIETQHKFEDE